MSCRSTSACRRLSRAVCAGDNNRGDSLAMDMSADEDSGLLGTWWSSTHRPGDVGGVKNSVSLELSSTGPMASGHLQSHFHTDELTRATSKGAMLRARDCYGIAFRKAYEDNGGERKSSGWKAWK